MKMTMPALVAATLLLATGLIAEAKTPRQAPQPRILEDLAPPEPEPQLVCRKSCETDMSPCDPQYMKNSDGRCSNPGTTIGF